MSRGGPGDIANKQVTFSSKLQSLALNHATVFLEYTEI